LKMMGQSAAQRACDDWRPPSECISDRHMGEIAAGLRADFVDHAEFAVEKDAPFLRIPQDS
jgi:hypothetical protein